MFLASYIIATYGLTPMTMNTIIDCRDAENDFLSPIDAEAAFETLRQLASKNQGISVNEWDCSNRDDCTYETQETDEIDEKEEAKEAGERQEPEELEEKEELVTLGPKLSVAIDKAISGCGVLRHGDVNGPLFTLAHEVRTMEEELNVRFSLDVNAEIVQRWQDQNHDHLENDHDYLAEFLDKLSLVRFPRGRALARAVEIAANIVPPKQTLRLCSDFQLLATLCGVLQQQAGKRPFFLDGRSAATALDRPHETVASWLRALRQLGVIRLISQGKRKMASRYEYIDQRNSNVRSR